MRKLISAAEAAIASSNNNQIAVLTQYLVDGQQFEGFGDRLSN
jgi:hypothetical protein